MSRTKNSADAGKVSMSSTDDDLFLVDPSVQLKKRQAVIVAISRILSLSGVLAIWEITSRLWIEPFWISSPTLVAMALVNIFVSGVLAANIYATVIEAVLGFIIGVAVGMMTGLVCGANRLISRILDPFLIGFYSVPRIALVPLFILWFGIGIETKVIYTALLVFFPVFMNTLSGVRDVSQDLIDVLRVMGASRGDTVIKVLIPSALAWLFAGLRISVPYALVGAIVSEMFTSNIGLGYLISFYANQFDTASLFATLAVITVLGLLINALVSRIEKHLLRWKPATS